jgi:predicted nuclease of restriction endonuclease-like (RecB) superfamily
VRDNMPRKPSGPTSSPAKAAGGSVTPAVADPGYDGLRADLSSLLGNARRQAARAVNVVLTATYWEVGRRVVEFEQGGQTKAGYGEELLKRLAVDLVAQHGRGFGWRNLFSMRAFYLGWEVAVRDGQMRARVRLPTEGDKLQTASAILPGETVAAAAFPLPWSHYVRLLSIETPHARQFYEEEAIRGAWSVRQLDRQIGSQFYERTALSRNKAALLTKARAREPGDALTPEEEIRDPLVLEFLALKDEYGENDLEEALVRHLEAFLLELGDDFCFVARQRKLRLDDKWFKVDLVFFHRRLRCLVLIDLKIGAFDHADAGQMNLYLNYAKAHWVREGENPPVGLILCAKKGHDEARYALEGLNNKVLASTYRTTLPDEKTLANELERTRRAMEIRAAPGETTAS